MGDSVSGQGIITRRGFLALASAGAVMGCSSNRGDRPQTSTDGQDSPGSSSLERRLTIASDILLGLSTSAYQIEGSVDQGGRGPSIWDTFSRQSGAIKDGSSGATACDHFRRWSADLDLMARLGLQSYRFSIAWPRILPEGRGPVNQRGLDFYRRLVDGLLSRGISPMVTLYHWDYPQALHDLGGWSSRDSAHWFADFAAVVFGSLAGVNRWLTINEPRIIVRYGYQRGEHAPGVADNRVAGRVLHHLGIAHGLAVQALRAAQTTARIGPCMVITPCYPADDSQNTARAVSAADLELNTVYLDPVLRGLYPDFSMLDKDLARGIESATRNGDLDVISQPVDFVGVNYYTPARIASDGSRRDNYPVTPFNWPIHPEGLFDVLRRLHTEYQVETAVTETGIAGLADERFSDPQRVEFLRDHLIAVQRAADTGCKIESFHAWSLFDNFEWAQGYTQRWGVVHVDWATQQRTLKQSAVWLADVISRHSVPMT